MRWDMAKNLPSLQRIIKVFCKKVHLTKTIIAKCLDPFFRLKVVIKMYIH